MNITLFTDGGSLNNPGQAAYGYAIYSEKDLMFSFSERIGIATNNIAEYTGLIKGLEKIKEFIGNKALKGIKKIIVKADSSLMVNQLNGLFRVKDSKIREQVFAIRVLENEINLPIIYIHIYREENVFADSLVKKALGR